MECDCVIRSSKQANQFRFLSDCLTTFIDCNVSLKHIESRTVLNDDTNGLEYLISLRCPNSSSFIEILHQLQDKDVIIIHASNDDDDMRLLYDNGRC
jgi:hypothetical protein